MKRRILFGVAAVVALALIAFVVVLVARPAQPEPKPETSPTDWAELPRDPAPQSPATAEPGKRGSDGAEFVLPFIAAEAAARGDRERGVDFSEVAIGAAAEDLAVNAQEMFEDGIVQKGEPKLVSATVTKRNDKADPPTMTVRVCLDYSSVELHAPDGTSVKDGNAAQRAASILVLSRVEGQWLVSMRTFPANPNC